MKQCVDAFRSHEETRRGSYTELAEAVAAGTYSSAALHVPSCDEIRESIELVQEDRLGALLLSLEIHDSITDYLLALTAAPSSFNRGNIDDKAACDALEVEGVPEVDTLTSVSGDELFDRFEEGYESFFKHPDPAPDTAPLAGRNDNLPNYKPR